MKWLLDHHEEIRNLGLVFAAGIALPLAIWRSLIAHRQTRIAENNHLADTYTKAIDQLGKEENEIRLGGLYALEKIAKNNRSYNTQVMEVLCAFVRLHAPRNFDEKDEDVVPAPIEPALKIVVQAALTIIGRRNIEFDTPTKSKLQNLLRKVSRKTVSDQFVRLDLSASNLSQMVFTEANLSGADLRKADLSGAYLSEADLSEADLRKADLSEASLFGANLSGADLRGANLSGAYLSGAYLSGADLSGANLSEAGLFGADLSGANLIGAKLIGAKLSGADLRKADLFGADLSGANVTLEQLQTAHVYKTTDLPGHIDKSLITFEELPF
ncbi:MAG: pentapeptide repeat-containing protein [Candidatus Nitrohelix vancouverensis]|uniref:Pentapeptide repeat-containing protein n=1 Tax=Candidatus Nitrohelix vancouverensis TaxID=2705534 RepID=A0A7T0C0T8_9BACT|nr:MAG: pentapeptide repeat-containing protein [Candidatus Nitrohelix vancouverensis]